MVKSLRFILTMTLCSLTMVASGGASGAEALHEAVHSLLSSTCSDSSSEMTDAVLPTNAAQISHVGNPCPIQLLLQSSLSQSLIVPVAIAPPFDLYFVSEFLFNFESADVASWSANWAFSRGPPTLA